MNLNANFGVSNVNSWVDLNCDYFGPKLGEYDITIRSQILKISKNDFIFGVYTLKLA